MHTKIWQIRSSASSSSLRGMLPATCSGLPAPDSVRRLFVFYQASKCARYHKSPLLPLCMGYAPNPRLDRPKVRCQLGLRPATSWTRLELTRGLRVNRRCFRRPRLRMTMLHSLSLLTDRLSSMATVFGHDNPFRRRHKIRQPQPLPF